MASARQPLSFDEFREVVAENLQVDLDRVAREASFINDLFADSIRMVELMLHLEQLGIEIPADAVWQMQTVGDAYDYYAEHLSPLPGEPGRVLGSK